MTAASQQIITAYEDLGLSIEQIAAANDDLEEASIKAILMQFSPKYRRDMKKDNELDFNEDQLIAANQVIANIAMYAEDPDLQFRAAKYLRNDKKGRLDVSSKMRGLNVNVLMLNEHMSKALDSLQKTKALVTSNSGSPIIELEEAKA